MDDYCMPKMSNHEAAESEDQAADEGGWSRFGERVHISIHKGSAGNVAQQHENVPTVGNQ